MKVHKTITFHFACEISSCTFRDKYRQKVGKYSQTQIKDGKCSRTQQLGR